jgi:hypothetical protein
MCAILQTWCQLQRTSSSSRFLNCGPGHIQCNYSSAHSGFNIHLKVFALLLDIYRQFNVSYVATMVPNAAHILQFTRSDPGHIQCKNSSTYLGFNSQLNVSPPLLDICRQFSERYTANMVPNAAHILQFSLSELWSRTYTMYLQLGIFRL